MAFQSGKAARFAVHIPAQNLNRGPRTDRSAGLRLGRKRGLGHHGGKDKC